VDERFARFAQPFIVSLLILLLRTPTRLLFF
jgi:hypothetical protein